MTKTIYIDLDKVKTINDLKLLIRLQASLSSFAWGRPQVVIKGKETFEDIIESMDHLIGDGDEIT